jgi:FtsH-binding integral membrane protein
MMKKPSIFSRIPVLTRILLAVFLLLAISLVFIGMDNETGVIVGWLAAAVLLAELTRRWRKPLYFFILGIASFAGVIFLAFLHEEVVYPLVDWLGGTGAIQSLPLKIFHEVISFIILFFGPTGIVIGILGAAVLLIIRLVSKLNSRKALGKT